MTMRRFTLLALALAIGLATALSPFASGSPDGLSKVAQRQGFGARGHVAAVQRHAPAAGYALPGVHEPRLAKGLAGFGGTLVVFLAGTGLVAVARRPRGVVA
jgi:F0F1-type ATP synthase membrane subunit c/vacuolar-type H+-ATPase subunit K